MSRSLHTGKCQSFQFPYHTADLILVFVQARDPPLSPLLQHGQPELVPHSRQPGDGSGDGDAVVDVAFEDPHSQVFRHEVRVQPVTGVIEHGVIGGNVVAASVESAQIDVHLGLNGSFIEKFLNTVHIFAHYSVGHHRHFAVDPPHIIFVLVCSLNLLVETLGIEVQHTGVGVVEFFVHNGSNFLACTRFVA